MTSSSLDVTSIGTKIAEVPGLHGGDNFAPSSDQSDDIIHVCFGSLILLPGTEGVGRKFHRADLSSDHTRDHVVTTVDGILEQYIEIG